MTERLCHVFRIAPGTEHEYRRRHDAIWPEMVESMRRAGFRDYTLFRRGDSVVAVCECEPDVQTCFARFVAEGVSQRWQEWMKDIVIGLVDEHGDLIRYDEERAS